MPLEDRKSFIADPHPDMTIEEKNKHLGAELAQAPHVRRKIVRVERIEIGGSGWWVFYRTGKP